MTANLDKPLSILINSDKLYSITPDQDLDGNGKGPTFRGIEIFFDEVTISKKVDWITFWNDPPQKIVIYKPNGRWQAFHDTSKQNLPGFIGVHHNYIDRDNVDFVAYWYADKTSPWYTDEIDRYIVVIYRNREQLKHK